MSLILSGSDGVSDIDGTVSTPAIRGTDSNTGIFFPAADTIAFSEGGVESMRIDSSGSLLVGQTTAAVETGSIVTAKNLEITRTVDSDGAALGQLSWVNNTNAGAGSGTSFVKDVACIKGIMDGTGNNSGGYITFETKADAGSRAERMRISSGGNLLVGTTSVPNSGTAISCFGNVYAFALNSGTNTWYQGTNGNEFNVYSADGVRRGYLTLAGTWTNTSDISYKKDIVDIKYSLEDALKLRPVFYLTKDYDIPQIGFIAQEMEQVIPEVVSGEEGSKGISYGSLVALCVKAIQEQQALIENLTTRLNALEGK